MTELQNADNWTEPMVKQEELKKLSFGDVWEEYCRACGVSVDGEWFGTIKEYENKVLNKRC